MSRKDAPKSPLAKICKGASLARYIIAWKMEVSMIDLIDEIKEDLHHERLGRLWQKYGSLVIGLAVLIVVATAGKVWWENRMVGQEEMLGKKYYQAIELYKEGKKADANALMDKLRKSDGKGYAVLGQLKKAEALLAANKLDEAIAVYHTIASDGMVEPVFQDLALLLATNLEIEHHKAERATIDPTLAKLASSKSVWRFSAMELQASYALELGDKAKALAIYTALNNEYFAPQDIRERAAEMQQALGGESK